MEISSRVTSSQQVDASKPHPVIALSGIPNSGKTTLFNSLTGMRYKVANYPGVTVEKKSGKSKLAEQEVTIVDLPGAYSLYGGSPDEEVAAEYLSGIIQSETTPDLVLCVLDACNLERNLYFASQVMDCGYPVVFALSMNDIAKRRGLEIRKELLARLLGAPVIDVSGKKREDLTDLKSVIKSELEKDSRGSNRFGWCKNQSYIDTAHALGESYLKAEDISTRDTLPTLIGIGLLTGAKVGGSELREQLLKGRTKLIEQGIDPSSYESEMRYNFANTVVKQALKIIDPDRKSRTERIDRVITHKIWGTLIFVMIMAGMFQAIFTWANLPMDFIDHAFGYLRNKVLEWIPEGQLQSLLADGVVAGVGGVLVFIPQIGILYLFISILEESGYLSRAAFLMDKLMRNVGLQGRSFIPLLSSFACAVPGMMATRNIPSFADRMATIMVLPLMSCSARLPVYTLLIAAFVPQTLLWGVLSLQGLVLLSMYLLGIIGAAASAFVFKKTLFKGAPTHFVMEMPPYRMPQLLQVLRAMLDRVIVFIRDAGTIIMACSIVLWFLASYPHVEDATPAESVRSSYAGQVGLAMEPIIAPLGFDWRIGVSIFASFAAREVFVSSMALVHNLESEDEVSDTLIGAVKNAKNPETGGPAYTPLTAISLMVFYVFACQCFSTLAVCKRETGSWKWPALMFVYMTVLAYVASLVTYQVGSRVWS
jgi:ferrous iron transport protein B